jgi:A/G-specific adenine glycosylase
MKIKGLGSYTVGAILSFAFHKKAAAVDGNVLRVLARYYCIEKDIAKGEVQKEIRQRAEELLPENQPWVVSEALIELGATVCGKKPRCGECPLKGSCIAYLKGVAEDLPLKSKSAKSLQLFRGVAVVECSGHLLLRQGKAGKVMADLYEFPYVELEEQEFSEKTCLGVLKGLWGLSVVRVGPMESVVHSFTKYKCTLLPHHVVVEHMHPVEGCQWISREAISKLPFSSGHKRLLLTMPQVSTGF